MAPLAAALLDASRSSSDPARSYSLVQLAVLAAPDDPAPHAALLSASLRHDFSVGRLLRELWAVLRTAGRDPWFFAAMGLGVAGTLPLAALLSAMALLLCALLKTGTALYHDFADVFPRRLRRFTPVAFLALMTAALFGAGIGPGGVMICLSLALLPYLDNRFRWALGLSLAIAMGSWGGLDWFSRLGNEPGKRAWAYYRAYKGDVGADLEGELAEGIGARSPAFLVARSAVARRGGRYDDARDLLVAAMREGAEEGDARVELGNLFFLDGQFREAEVEYRRAAAVSPRNAVPWVNLHVLFLRRIELAEADRALDAAKVLDAEVVDRFQREARGGRGGLLPLSVALEWRPVMETLWFSAMERGSGWAETLSESLFVGYSAVRPAYLGGVVLAAALLAGSGSGERRSRRCPRCGEIICPRCSRRIKGEQTCSACWSLTEQKGAEAAEKERQRGRVESWQRKRESVARILLVVSPGWSRFVNDGSLVGLGIGILWGLSAGAALFSGLYPAAVLPWDRLWLGWLPWFLFLGCHLYGLRQAGSGPRARAGR